MLENSRVNFIDTDDITNSGTIAYKNNHNKIKFMKSSFSKFKTLYKNFRLKKLNKKLEKEKEKLQFMQIPSSDFYSEYGEMSKGEKRILKKTKKIAELEYKINYLSLGIKPSPEVARKRAIKLKNNMMKNFVINANSAYEQEDENKNFNNEEIQNIDSDNQEDNTKNDNLSSEKIQSVIDDTFKQKENSSISDDEIKNMLDEKLEEVNVNSNDSIKSRTAFNIQPNGEYHLRRDQIDEDFRITRVDSKNIGYLKGEEQIENPEKNDIADEKVVKGEGNVSPIENTLYSEEINNNNPRRPKLVSEEEKDNIILVADRDEIKKQNNEDNKKEEKVNKFNFTSPVDEEVENNFVDNSKEDNEDKENIEVPTPETTDENLHFNYSDTTPKDLEKVVERAKNKDDLKYVLARVEELKAEKKESEAKLQEAKKEASESEERLRETEAKLREFSKSLEEDCNNNSQQEQEFLARRDDNIAKIDAMMSLMAESNPNESETIKKGR